MNYAHLSDEEILATIKEIRQDPTNAAKRGPMLLVDRAQREINRLERELKRRKSVIESRLNFTR